MTYGAYDGEYDSAYEYGEGRQGQSAHKTRNNPIENDSI